MTGRIVVLALVALSGLYVDAFTPSSFQRNGRSTAFLRMATSDENDLSIPYDSAARMAYDQWRRQYNKGDFDEERFASFKANYEAITIANVSAKKVSRDSGSNAPRMLTLNEFGDYTAEEYEAMQAGAAGSAPSVDVLGKAFQAAQSQAGAATALMEAADALAEEEEKLARQLGLESIEELEAAVDALEGIDEEGVQGIDNLAREARVRSAYLEWCKENGKESDETRFPTFFDNFLKMETFAATSGKEMVLNRYADCTQEEYLALMKSSAPAPSPDGETAKALMVTAVSGNVADDSDILAALQAVAEAEAAANAAESAEKNALTIEADAKAEAARQAKLELAEKKKAEIAARATLASLSLDEQRERTEKERKERQAAQEKAAEELRRANEAAAIAVVKEQEAREASQVAKRKQFDLEAAEQARRQAREWEDKQEKLRARSAPTPKTKPKQQPKSIFESLVPKPAPQEPEKVSRGLEVEIDLSSILKIAEPAKKASPAPAPLFNFFEPTKPNPKAASKPKPKVASTPAPMVASKTETKVDTTFNFFGNPAPKAVSKGSSVPSTPKVVAKPAPKAVSKPEAKAIDTGFNFFGNPAPKAVSKPAPIPLAKPVSKPAPKSVAKSGPLPSFSFFSSPAPAPKVSPKAVPAPLSKPAPQPFSFFASPPKPVATPPAPSPPVVQPFSFFGSPKPAPAPKVAPSPTPVPKSSFSFFGSSPSPPAPAKVKDASTKKAPSTPVRRSGTIALKKANPKNDSGGFSLFGAAAKQDDIPVLSKFKQNKDGSLTGIVSNASGFKTGTKITTSPVRMGAKAGQVVTTESGSKYRLA